MLGISSYLPQKDSAAKDKEQGGTQTPPPVPEGVESVATAGAGEEEEEEEDEQVRMAKEEERILNGVSEDDKVMLKVRAVQPCTYVGASDHVICM